MNNFNPCFISLLLLCLGLEHFRAQQSKIEMQWGEKNLPVYYSSDHITKWLSKYTDSIEGILRWQDKKGHE